MRPLASEISPDPPQFDGGEGQIETSDNVLGGLVSEQRQGKVEVAVDRSSSTAAATAMVVGGVLGSVVFVPFTVTHGPTSYNVGLEVLGWDMHNWGFLLGTVPPLLIGTGLWLLRELVAGGRRAAVRALTVMSVALLLFVAMTVAGQAMGPPFELVLLAPASVVAALTTRREGLIRAGLLLLAVAYCAALAMQLVPMQTSDSIGGFRIFGAIAYAGVGVLWAAFGMTLLLRERGGRPAN